jgi:hypothetical protein
MHTLVVLHDRKGIVKVMQQRSPLLVAGGTAKAHRVILEMLR